MLCIGSILCMQFQLLLVKWVLVECYLCDVHISLFLVWPTALISYIDNCSGYCFTHLLTFNRKVDVFSISNIGNFYWWTIRVLVLFDR